MKAYGTIYKCNLDAGELDERTMIIWDTAWYSGDKAVFQVVLYKNGDIIIGYANMSNASTAGQTGRGTVYKGISRGDNTDWMINTWNNINENMNHRSFKYEYQDTTPTTTTTTSSTTTITTSTTTITEPTTTTTTTSSSTTTTYLHVKFDDPCSLCSGWVTRDTSHIGCNEPYDGCVRRSDGSGYYDLVCCSGNC